jgi:hypothetical protein
MEADLGISRWAVVALVAAMIAVGALGLGLRAGAAQDSTDHKAPASTTQSR